MTHHAKRVSLQITHTSHPPLDIIEGVDDTSVVTSTLHTNEGCSMYGQSSEAYTGTMASFDCDVNAAGQSNNQGCGIIGSDNSMGDPFNQGRGGVYATGGSEKDSEIRTSLRSANV